MIELGKRVVETMNDLKKAKGFTGGFFSGFSGPFGNPTPKGTTADGTNK